MSEIEDYTVAIVDRAKTFGYEELYADVEPLGNCPSCGRPVIEMAWFYRCEEDPPREDDCPMRFWKDTSGRYLDRATVRALLRDGKTGEIDGFTARNGRTYRGTIEVDDEEWKLKVRSVGWNEDSASDQPEYDVNPEPLGRCPFEEECAIVESPTQFVCERRLKEAEFTREELKQRKADGVPQSCGFVLPRTVCKREITRDEALHYLGEGKTELLTDFTSRFGRPFSAILVLKENGRHGFEFPPRGEGAGRKAAAGKGKTKKSADAVASPKPRKAAARRKKATRRKTARKGTTRKGAARKGTARQGAAQKGTGATARGPSAK
jgi:DNA topoisomerase-3